jgi:hypothetical protein
VRKIRLNLTELTLKNKMGDGAVTI